jgi:3-deoxy-7-phosphoheptulonate synthase
MEPTQDLNIVDKVRLIAPSELKVQAPMTEKANATVVAGRQAVCDVLSGDDPRLLVIVGPCSIHDEEAAIEYAERIRGLSERVSDHLLLVMRVYFEKPRTIMGWKGLINDPNMDGTFDVHAGLLKARTLLLKVNEMGVPAASEMLDPITPQYTADLVAWASIGARTTESQTHRQMASGLSMPVGFKNGTDGNLQHAINAMAAARHPHRFLGIDDDGQTCLLSTKGNPWDHLILRGGQSQPNYSATHVSDASARLTEAGLRPLVMVDCSHANSRKDYRRQPHVWRDVLEQRIAGNDNVCGMMVESNIHEGNQGIPDDLSQLAYGVSVTDACISWEQTEELLISAHKALTAARDLSATKG